MEIQVQSQCITVMDHYKEKSIEEIRLEDYNTGRNKNELSVENTEPLEVYSSGNRYGVRLSDDKDDDHRSNTNSGMAEHVIIPSRPPPLSNTVFTHPSTHVQKPNVPLFPTRPTPPSNNSQPKTHQPNKQTTTVLSSKQHVMRTVPGDRPYSRAHIPTTSIEVNSGGKYENQDMIDLQVDPLISDGVGCRNSNMHSSENVG